MITESRVAITISLAALLVTGFQAWSANEANQFNKEKVTIEAVSSDNPSARIGATTCWNDIVTTELNWRVTVFNNSTQAVTIKELQSIATSPAGMSASNKIYPAGPINRLFPALIEAKNFKTFEVTLPTQTSTDFAKWFMANGGCKGNPVWPSPEARKRFDETGWAQYGQSGALFTAISGGGEKFFIQAVWR